MRFLFIVYALLEDFLLRDNLLRYFVLEMDGNGMLYETSFNGTLWIRTTMLQVFESLSKPATCCRNEVTLKSPWAILLFNEAMLC